MENGTMMLLPAKAGTCEQCATAHEPHLPHNAQSLFYQVKFQMENGRGPTWLDAMAHCTAEMQAAWMHGLKERGVDVEGGAINPPRKGMRP